MRTIIICRGLPASGKSTYAKDLLKREPGRWVRVNKDDIRSMLHNSIWSQENEEMTRKAHDNTILIALRNDKDVIVDNTNLVPASLRKLHKLFESVGNIKVLERGFNVSIAEAKRRNALREGKARVPDSVIDGMAKGSGIDRGRELQDKEFYYPPRDQQTTLYRGNADLPAAIICDLDGTLSLLNGRNPYDASTCDNDLPNKPVIECVKAMHAAGHKIVFMSGREDQYREPTKRFIAQYLPDIPYELFMRATADSRKDAIVKGELFEANVREKYNVSFVLDDRNQVVDFWRSIGLNVFQVAEGNF